MDIFAGGLTPRMYFKGLPGVALGDQLYVDLLMLCREFEIPFNPGIAIETELELRKGRSIVKCKGNLLVNERYMSSYISNLGKFEGCSYCILDDRVKGYYEELEEVYRNRRRYRISDKKRWWMDD